MGVSGAKSMQDAGANGFKGAVEGTTLAVSVGLNRYIHLCTLMRSHKGPYVSRQQLT
jgi:hypothetical protein